jgi:hypothetical protein
VRITCNSIEEFLENLKHTEPGSVLKDMVCLSVTRKPLDGRRRIDAVRFDVTIQTSAVINLPDGGQYLLEYGEECGRDYMDGNQERPGTMMANSVKQALMEYCNSAGLVVRPGVIDF